MEVKYEVKWSRPRRSSNAGPTFYIYSGTPKTVSLIRQRQGERFPWEPYVGFRVTSSAVDLAPDSVLTSGAHYGVNCICNSTKYLAGR